MKIISNLQSFKKYFWIYWIAFLFVGAWEAKADDFYNFYFQKAEKGKITNGAPEVASPSIKNSVNPSAAVLPTQQQSIRPSAATIEAKASVPEAKFSRWEIGFGYSWLADPNYSVPFRPFGMAKDSQSLKGGEFSLRFNFSRLIAARLSYALLELKREISGYTVSNFNDERYPFAYVKAPTIHHVGSAEVVFTPLRLTAKNFEFLSLGFGMGVTRNIRKDIKPFIKPELALFFSDSVGFQAQYRQLLGNEYPYTGELLQGPDSKILNVGMVIRL